MATISLKVLVDKEKNRIVFAESDADFVDILLSFLTIPMGSIVRIVGNQSPMGIGCMRNLYKSIENLKDRHLRTEACKTMLLYPRSTLESHYKKLKLKIEDKPVEYYLCNSGSIISTTEHRFLSFYSNLQCQCGRLMCQRAVGPDDLIRAASEDGVFVRGEELQRYIISDDLVVFAISNTNKCMSLLDKLDIREACGLVERTVNFTSEEVLLLLNRSLLSDTPMTDVILTKGDVLKPIKIEQIETTQYHKGNEAIKEAKKISMKVMVRRSNNELLFAEAGKDFIDLLFHFLTFPLGSIVKLSFGKSSIGCIDNLYKSVEYLSADNCIKSEECMAMLLNPKLPPYFGSDNQLLPLEEEIQSDQYNCRWLNNDYYVTRKLGFASSTSSENNEVELKIRNPKFTTCETTNGGGFIKGPEAFMVTDGLVVEPLSQISKLLLLSAWNVPFSDIEEHSVTVSAEEALNILKASLVTEKALSSIFNK